MGSLSHLGKQQQQMKNILINKQLEQQHQIFLPPSTSSPQYYSKYLIQQQSSSTSINNLYDIEGQQYFNKNSGSFDQSLSASFQPIKPTRGRKRKKVFKFFKLKKYFAKKIANLFSS